MSILFFYATPQIRLKGNFARQLIITCLIMQVGSYLITCCFETPASLPRFKGSALRGAFGHGLKRVCCAQRWQSCEQCLLAEACAYSYIFLNHKTKSSSPSKLSSRPHPYVLSPVDNGTTVFQVGDEIVFKLLLFGSRAVGMLPYIVYALMEMGKTGLGKGNRSGSGRFKLLSVRNDKHLFYDYNRQEFVHSQDTIDLRLVNESVSCGRLLVNFSTPLRMKNKQRLVTKPDFQTLVRGVLRRVSSLEDAYGEGYPELNYKELIDRAAGVKSELADTRWYETTRYSNRQKQKMNFGGIVGQAIYQGNLTAFLPLFRYCEIVHIGKQTTFGLGKIKLETE